MKSTGAITLIVGFALMGCTQTRLISVDGEAAASYSEINVRAAKSDAKIVTTTEIYAGSNLQLATDSASWFDTKSGEMVVVETAEISEIQFISRRRGMIQGMGFGSVIGAALGGAMGGMAGDDPPCPQTTGGWFENPWCVRFSGAEKAGLGAILLGATGAIIGPAIGGIRGRTTRYLLHSTLSPPRVVAANDSPAARVSREK